MQALFSAESQSATCEDWLKRVSAALRGGAYDELASTTIDGLRIEPIYSRAIDAGLRALPRFRDAWEIAQRVDHPDPRQANRLALIDAENGAECLVLTWQSAAAARGFGLRADTLDELDTVLDGISLDTVNVRLEPGEAGRRAAALFAALVARRGLDPARVHVDFGWDPAGALARSGRLALDIPKLGSVMAEMHKSLRDRGFLGTTFLADGRVFHEAGASQSQELAAVLATAVQYLRLLADNGHSADEARRSLALLLVADADQFLTLAKFRALRRLWARVEEACELAPLPIRLHAETAWRMTTRPDPWVNILRATIAVFSAGLGGADAISVLPFTAALGLPDELARRIARNTQLVLLKESHLGKVTDPSGGTGSFESLTDALCEKAWHVFQTIEQSGGLIACLSAGMIQREIGAVSQARARAVARRQEKITGTNEFPNVFEEPVSVLMRDPVAGQESAAARARGSTGHATPLDELRSFETMISLAKDGAAINDLLGVPQGPAITCSPLASHRDAEPFEALRDAADDHLARTGARPQVFLANLGQAADFATRAMFAKNFFEAGGIEAVTNDGFETAEQAVEAFVLSRAQIACLCSSDANYAQGGAALANALAAAGAALIFVAGRKGASFAALEEAGVKKTISEGCDALAVLRAVHEHLAVADRKRS